MAHSLDGKRVWLIGASAGIGEALAEKLASKGATLIVSARSVDKLEALRTRLGPAHGVERLDVTDVQSVNGAWAALSASGIPDTVVYNPGTYEPQSALHFNLAEAEAMVDVNFRGALRVLSVVLPAFIARGSGHIVLVGSSAAYSGLPNAIGYGASKAALLHLAENLRLDLKDTAIRVQVVSPGFVKTRLTDKNSFAMPGIITAPQAADHIVRGMATDRFDIHFPAGFTWALKFLRLLPYRLYFWVAGKIPA